MKYPDPQVGGSFVQPGCERRGKSTGGHGIFTIMTMVALITEMFSGIEKKNKMSSYIRNDQN